MGITSGFFNSLNGDRKYDAEQLSAIFDGVVNDGIFANIGTAFGVKAVSGINITVGIGRAWFNSTWLNNDAVYPITADVSEVILNRYDAVVIEINHDESVRNGTIKIIKGTPASSPTYPTLTKTTYVNQYPLAYIYRAAGSTVITQANIQNMIGTSSCPYITGILQVQNIDKIVAQWETQWNEWFGTETSTSESAWDNWYYDKTHKSEKEWDQWYTNETTTAETELDNWENEQKTAYYEWFASLKYILDGNVAAKLAAAIVDMQERFHLLHKERAVCETLFDSNGEAILDNAEIEIAAKTAFEESFNSIPMSIITAGM